MPKPRIRLTITDLDNTLYDWVTFFSAALAAMVDAAHALTGIDRDTIFDDLRAVHQRYGNSEQPFALAEAACFERHFGPIRFEERVEKLDAAFHAFNRARKATLVLYPTVATTLPTLAAQSIVVGHTEAIAPNAAFRIVKLGIEPCFARIYTAPDMSSRPPRVANDWHRDALLRFRALKPGERKPNPAVVLDICQQWGVRPDECLYIGDSLSRDVGMAKAAGAHTAWARYGTRYDRDAWALLVRVTHWTADDVARAEEAARRYHDVKPDVTLDEFADVFSAFEFEREPVVIEPAALNAAT